MITIGVRAETNSAIIFVASNKGGRLRSPKGVVDRDVGSFKQARRSNRRGMSRKGIGSWKGKPKRASRRVFVKANPFLENSH